MCREGGRERKWGMCRVGGNSIAGREARRRRRGKGGREDEVGEGG